VDSLRRRGIFAGALASVAALVVGRSSAVAAAENEPVLLGTRNSATSTTSIERVPGYPPDPCFGAISPNGIGLLGVVYGDGPLQTPGASINDVSYPSAGVFGIGHDRVGIWGRATSGMGAWGQSDTGIGVIGQTGPSNLTQANYPVAGVLGVDNTGATAGTWGLSGRGIGAWGQSDTGIGVAAQSNNIGAWFKKGNVPQKVSELEPAAFHATAMGTDIAGCVRADKGVGLMAEAEDAAGFAIVARGRIASDMVMKGKVAAGSDVAYQPCIRVSDQSHVAVTLRSDIGALVSYVEIQPGRGVTIHFNKIAKADGVFTYSVVDIAPAEPY